jgi:PAS domain-containing protein
MAERLVFLTGPHTGTEHSLGEWTSVSIGRAPTNDVRVNDESVALLHCMIERRGLLFQLVDCDSPIGTTVNGRAIKQQYLLPGDVIGLGRAELRFEFEDSSDPGQTSVELPDRGHRDTEAIELTARRIQERLSTRTLRIGTDSEKVAARGALLLSRLAALGGEANEGEQFLQQALELARKRLPASRGAIILRSADGRMAPAVAQRAPDDPPGVKLKVDQQALRRVLREGNARCGDFEDRTFACAPIRQGEAITGAIYVDQSDADQPLGDLHAQLLSAAGNIIGLSLGRADLQARLAASTAAAGGEALVKSVLDGIMHSCLLVDLEGVITHANEGAVALLGEVEGKLLEERVHLDDQLRFVSAVGSAQQGEPQLIAVRVLNDEEEAREFEARISPLQRGWASIDGIVVAFTPR